MEKKSSKMVTFYSSAHIQSLVSKRTGETKLGEVLQIVARFENLSELSAQYILVGIPEDVGVRANFGNPGTSTAWGEGFQALCNLQSNHLLQPDALAVLGAIDCDFEMKQAAKITGNDPHRAEKLGELVTQIDHKVAHVVEKIVIAGKIPIVIGGGHNNSFGNLKGASKAIGRPLNCINMDAHSDFRALEHRHSGNGFSYAKNEGFLNKYHIVGLHRNYTSEAIFNQLKMHAETIQYSLFENQMYSENSYFSKTLKEAEEFCCHDSFGMELDMDAIANMGSSAMTPSGYSVEEARQFLEHFTALATCQYIHICEGSPSASLFSNQVGKTIAYFISDIISTT